VSIGALHEQKKESVLGREARRMRDADETQADFGRPSNELEDIKVNRHLLTVGGSTRGDSNTEAPIEMTAGT
jgi:hypothetical protein